MHPLYEPSDWISTPTLDLLAPSIRDKNESGTSIGWAFTPHSKTDYIYQRFVSNTDITNTDPVGENGQL